jgi:protein-S-isoprenylcysteine O-methyltransferase Ste14
MLEHVNRKLRHVVESLIAILLFSLQQIPVVFSGTFPMLFPLAAYFASLLWLDAQVLPLQIRILLFDEGLMIGRIVTVIGLILFLIAFSQFVRHRGRFITSGFYSVVRHPQYLSLIVMAFGISLMARECRLGRASSRLFPLDWFPWLILVFGYVLLAFYEESRLTKEYTEYGQYKKEVPMLFPIPHNNRIQEVFMSVTIIILMQFILTL